MPGKVTLATVLSVYAYGIWVDADSEALLVHIWDESWYWPYEASRHVASGERIRVWVGEEERRAGPVRIASLRKVRPELDPRRTYGAGDVVRGTVDVSDDRGISVSVGQGQFVDYSDHELSPAFGDWKAITVGDTIEARAELMGDEDPQMFLRPVTWVRKRGG